MTLRRCLRLALGALAATRSIHAQSMTGISAVDSASVARSAWERATSAFNAHDLDAARREVERAARAWPTQPAYLWAWAVTAQLTNDTAAVLTALDAYAALGLGRDLRADARFSGYATLPRFAAIAARHDRNRVPLARSRVVATLPDSTFWPEGVDHDSRTGKYYVASVRHRTIAEVANGVMTRELWPRDQPAVGAVLGVRVDARRGVLWATLAGIPQMHGFTASDSTIAALVRIRIADGTIERRWDLPPARAGHVLGDIAIGPLGDVFATDSYDPVLYRLRPASDSLQAIRSPLFRSLQGMAPMPNGLVVYVADYSHGLLRVDLATNTVTRVEDAPGSTSLGCDGIAWDHGAIVAVQNGVSPARIMRFALDSTGRRIVRAELLDQNVAIADEPTIGAVVGDEFVYVANSQWEKYTGAGVRNLARRLTAPVLLGVALPAGGRH
jgi:DNA-binding beta-propeller fold protein YncE